MKTKLHLLLVAIFFGISMNSQTKISIVGDFNGWNNNVSGAANMITSDNEHFTFAALELPIGGFKFVVNNDWPLQIGGTTFPNGTGIQKAATAPNPDPANVPGTAGFWDVTFKLSTLEYTFTSVANPYAVIKLSGAGLSTDLTIPATINSAGAIYFKESTVIPVGGDAKFIGAGTSSNWSSIDFPSGIGTQDGALIPVTKGAYNIYFYTGTNEYVFGSAVVSLMGSLVGSGWGTDIDLETTDGLVYTKDNFVIDSYPDDLGVKPTTVGLKIRDNHKWTSNQFGLAKADKDKLIYSGTASQDQCETFTLPLGTYNISFNRVTLEFSFTSVLSINSFASKSFSVYPNPTQNSWKFASVNSDISSVVIVDMLGRSVMSKKASSKEVSVDASGLSKGMYFAKVTSGDSVQTLKVVKN
jgi:hypothetical protein